ncbi:MAG: CHASE2 and HATPase_c domain-containing protein [Proteobacteria bacterium]|nr:CHASE2 and HATPase_c domain-containing protein [Pseudomonadota bacterium]MCL2307047.1 CHASE2 and HATPase_c domain-containing protein [Pseudomonadota bacterium]
MLRKLLAYRVKHPTRLYIEWILFVVVALTFCGVALHNQWFWRVNHMLYDAALHQFHRPPPDDIVILAIGDDDISRIGQWPWPREIHTRAINRLTEAGARAVLVDVLFNEPDRRTLETDEMLADAIRRNGRVVLPLIHAKTRSGSREHLPIPLLVNAAAGLGHIHSEVDLDGIIRSTYLFEGLGEARWPHAALALLKLTDPQSAARYQGESASEPLFSGANTWQRKNWFHIPFFGPPGHFKSHSYARWAAGEIPLDAVRDRIVFIGTTATGLGDAHPTPVSGFSRPMGGVEINAHIFEALRLGINLRVLPTAVSWALFSLMLLLLFAAFFRLRPGPAVVVTTIVLIAGYCSTEFFLYTTQRIVQPASFLLAAMLSYPLWSWRRLAMALRFLEQENLLLRLQPGALTSGHPTTFHPFIEPVSRSIESLRKTHERLEAAHRERESFLNFLSHDMRSPQSSIIALIEMRQQGHSHLTDDECFEKIEQYARKTSRLADEFVMHAKALQLTPADLKELELTALIDETLDEIWPLAIRYNIAIHRDYVEEAFVLGHQTLLARAVFNLVHNAIKFSPDGSEITVSVIDENSFWRVVVKDQGIGLSQEAQQRLLGSPEDHASPTETGLVLGLALVRTVVDRHGGALKISSLPGKGATFSFRLPKVGG